MQRPQTLLASTFDLIAEADLDAVAEVLGNNPGLIDQPTFFAGGTLLHYAAAKSTPEMVGLLLSLGFSVDARGKHYGDTPLHAACSWGRTENGRVLLAKGAALDGTASHTDPLFGAVLSQSLETVAFIVGAGADVRRRHMLESGDCVDAAEFARSKGYEAIEAFLRSAGDG